MSSLPFFKSIRAKLLLIALLLLLVPLIGFRFVQQMDIYLRNGQQEVLASSAKLLAASLSNRAYLFQGATPASAGEADELERRRVLGIFSGADPAAAAGLGSAYVPSEEVERMLSVVAGDSARIWVVDARSRVLGLAGNVRPYVAPASNAGGWFSGFYSRAVRPVLRLLAPSGEGSTEEDPSVSQRLVMSQVDRALVGEPNIRTRPLGPGGLPVVSVAQPVWQGDSIVAAVVVEESAGSLQAIKTAALESLLAMTLVVLLAGFLALLGFSWWLTARVRGLQAEADRVIDANGRIVGNISGLASRDEIGALAQTLNATVVRLQRYNSYLEQMAGRLAHELRTPVAVVRSSLDNLRQGGLPAGERVYLERAEEGLARLSGLISRMSEASQLEGMLSRSDSESFDLAKLVSSCVEGYRHAYRSKQFELKLLTGSPASMRGVPDAIAQLLDKLVQNAVDFVEPGTAIRISITPGDNAYRLEVENDGPAIPVDRIEQMFVSMVSTRIANADANGHLGLGLYIARIIAEHHGGSVSARNLANGRGVCFEVALPR